MKPREMGPGIYSVGAADWERRLFDSLIPLPEGTSYNAYLVTGSEATVLFDTVDPRKTHVLLENLAGVERLDYVVLHHAEQDHSGSLGAIVDRFPGARLICSPKAAEILGTHLRIATESFTTVEDGEEISLGNKTMRFLHTPWVHWPETMCTYLVEDKVLVTCDLFGSHLATSDLFVREAEVIPAAKRYFAEIMMPFRPAVKRNLDKLAPLPVDLIAPSHGPAYADPSVIVAAYRDWVEGPPKNLAVIPYVTMHGSTLAMVERLTAGLIDKGIKAEPFDLSVVDLGGLATNLVDVATIVVGTPTVMLQPHPVVMSAINLVGVLRPNVKFLSVMVSYGWSSKAVETIASMTAGLKAEIIEPVVVKGLPGPDELALVDALADAIAAKHAEAGLL
ncbi:MAG: FprA family A-type flavoprotein [Actinobacteria bacterium]|nr:FprA family A-type flavoprotein [Actinomycetota bacterium]